MAPTYTIDPSRDYSIAIAGGGIGGLATAIGLLHAGIDVHIYEAAPAFAEIGAGVSLGPNAARAMKLIDPAIHAGFLKCATNNAWPEYQQSWFSFRKGENRDNSEQSASEQGAKFFDLFCETGQSSVHRARFLDELVALVPEERSHFGKRLESVTDEGDDGVIIRFADGTEARHNALIGCDGIKSNVRLAVIGRDTPASHAVFTGKYAYRGLIPMDEAAALLGDEVARNSQMYLGRGGHILTFPIEQGATMNVVAFSTKEDGKWEDNEWVKPLDHKAMERDFEGWTAVTGKILSLMRKSDCWALFHHLPAPTYFKNRVCILGDAAHASTPHNGAGAGQALEDALIMSRVLALVRDGRELSRAFAAFDAVRRPRSQRQVRVAEESGLLYDLQAPGVGAGWERVKEKLGSKQGWLWEHDLQGDVKEVEGLFREEVARL
ncbi:hypothetical protein LTR62_002543 [Meristemomyces frigidus]|uniref:FAD-binding domain-containing protein n=1 Tax=Meristemomyces frigidus TaxID=1508187 RepID=A0AAN7TLZ3_9PEZI|nr:hypothetical protein LTR62_002543 [Meristemomyces frigidus]